MATRIKPDEDQADKGSLNRGNSSCNAGGVETGQCPGWQVKTEGALREQRLRTGLAGITFVLGSRTVFSLEREQKLMAPVLCRGQSVTRACAQLCPTVCDSRDCGRPGSSDHGIFQARMLEWAARFLLQRIFPTQGSNPSLLRWQVDSLPLSHCMSSFTKQNTVQESSFIIVFFPK